MLFLPNAEPSQVGEGLKVLSDYVFRDLFLVEEIEKERGVILAELRAGTGAAQRMRDKLYPQLFAGSRFAERLPIGVEEVISGATRDDFEAYYRTWYRPENMTLIMIGDSEFEPLRPQVEQWFGQYRPEVPAQPAKGPEFKPFTEQRAMVVTDPEYAQGEIVMVRLRPGRAPTTTVEVWRTELLEYLACRMVERRLEERLQKGEATFQSAHLGVQDFYHDALLASGSASGKPEDWEKVLEELTVEISRARQFGFNEREFELAKAEVTAALEQAAETASTRDAQRMLFTMAQHCNGGEPIMSPQQELDLLNRMLPDIQLDELKTVFAEHFAPDTFAWVLKMPEKEGVELPTEEAVLAAARAAVARKVEPPVEKKGAGDLLVDELTPGKVVESAMDEDLAITSAWLENGVRVHHRYMDYHKDVVFISISLAGGRIEETAENVGVTRVASLAFDQARGQAATKRLSSTDITDIMTGEKVRISGGPGDDALVMQINGSPEDLETGLKLAHALLIGAKVEESAFKNWQERSIQQLTMAEKMPQFGAVRALRDLTSGGDPRRMLPTTETIERQTLEDAQAWLERLCGKAPIEVAVVGGHHPRRRHAADREVHRVAAGAPAQHGVPGSAPQAEPQVRAARAARRGGDRHAAGRGALRLRGLRRGCGGRFTPAPSRGEHPGHAPDQAGA